MRAHPKSPTLVETVATLLKNASILVKQIAKLFALESRLARKSLSAIILLSFILFGLSLSTWTLLLCLLALFFQAIFHHWATSLALTAIVNIILLLTVAKTILNLGKNLQFSRTRKHLFSWGEQHHALKTAASKD